MHTLIIDRYMSDGSEKQTKYVGLNLLKQGRTHRLIHVQGLLNVL